MARRPIDPNAALHWVNHAYGEGFLCALDGNPHHRDCKRGSLRTLVRTPNARYAIDDQHMQGGRDGDACAVLEPDVVDVTECARA